MNFGVSESNSVRLSSRPFYDKKMGQEIDGAIMGEQFRGYVFRITGGNDKQGFTMKQGIFKQGRTRILFKRRKYSVGLVCLLL